MPDGIMAISIVEIDLAPALAKVFYPNSSDYDKQMVETLVRDTLHAPLTSILRITVRALVGHKVSLDDDHIHRMIEEAISIFGDIETELNCAKFREKNTEEDYLRYVIPQYEAMLACAVWSCFCGMEFEIIIAGLPPDSNLN